MARAVGAKPVTNDPRTKGDAEATLARWVARSIPVIGVLGAVVAYAVYDIGAALLVLAFGTLLGAIAIFWTSLRTLSENAPLSLEDALALAAPTAAAEQKRAVLAAIRDLDYERSVGKISEADHALLLSRYRAEAKRLIRLLDEDRAPLRARADAYAVAHASDAPDTAGERRCGRCRTANDADAAFCKKCGTKLGVGEGDHGTA
jgi:hypothetical protein